MLLNTGHTLNTAALGEYAADSLQFHFENLHLWNQMVWMHRKTHRENAALNEINPKQNKKRENIIIGPMITIRFGNIHFNRNIYSGRYISSGWHSLFLRSKSGWTFVFYVLSFIVTSFNSAPSFPFKIKWKKQLNKEMRLAIGTVFASILFLIFIEMMYDGSMWCDAIRHNVNGKRCLQCDCLCKSYGKIYWTGVMGFDIK